MEEDEGVDESVVVVVVVVVTGGVVVVVTTGGRVVTGGLVTGGLVTGGCVVVVGCLVVVTGGGGVTVNWLRAMCWHSSVAVKVYVPTLVPGGMVAVTEPVDAYGAVASTLPAQLMRIVPLHLMKPDQVKVVLEPAGPLLGFAVTVVCCCAAAGVATSTVTPAATATSKPKDRIPSPRIRT
ncbi:hypothetical protein GCM10011609_37210 [Lentzea pudingi]|uniref:Uncharacterized protein n=1 Tax=Lentzea pudingi TaxID=1789439 RepID=A0ABQ2I1Z7_9PSEU|nr:hypothetical protein GCM10011609_37210 [Lentzea pudingi]